MTWETGNTFMCIKKPVHFWDYSTPPRARVTLVQFLLDRRFSLAVELRVCNILGC